VSRNYKEANHTFIESVSKWRICNDDAIIRIDDSNDTVVTYAALYLKLAAVLSHWVSSYPQCDTIVVSIENSDDFVVLFYASIILGKTFVPVKADISAGDLFEIAKKVGAQLIIIQHQCETDARFNVVNVRNFMDKVGQSPERFDIDASRLCEFKLIIFTSGTTSRSKGAVLTLANLVANTQSLIDVHQLNPDLVHLNILPFSQMNALGLSMFTTLHIGGLLVIARGRPLPLLWSYIEKYKVTHCSVVPSVLSLLSNRSYDTADLTNFRYFITAAAPLTKKVYEQFFLSTGMHVRQGYGLTETTNFTSTVPATLNASEIHLVMMAEAIPTVGIVLSDQMVVIVDENNMPMQSGDIGRICVAGESVFSGYMNQKTEEFFDLDGTTYFETGDLGYFKTFFSMNFLFLTGRSKELIIRSGVKYYPHLVDSEIQQVGLDNVTCVGFQSEAYGEEIGLYVGAAADTSAVKSAIEANVALQAVLNKYNINCVVIGRQSEAKTETGKKKRLQLSERFNRFKNKVFISREYYENDS